MLWVNHGVLKEAQTSVESDMLYHLVEEPIVGNGFSKGICHAMYCATCDVVCTIVVWTKTTYVFRE